MNLEYSERADASSVLLRGPLEPGGDHHKERLDAARFVRYDDHDRAVLAYEFLNVHRYGVRLDDLAHRDELRTLFREAGFAERDWGHAIPTRVIRHRTGVAG